MIKSILKDKRGATTTEYAILIGLLALVVLGAVQVFGKNLKTKITSQADAVANIGSGSLESRRGSALARSVANRHESQVS
jgi:Flp pilus assembly pilin Flp